ncbi:MAG: acetylornithine deacetylase [Rickettsiales bacterium]
MIATHDVLTERSLQMISKLVSFDSISHLSNLPLIRFIEDYLALHHIEYELIPSEDGQKSNLLARIGPNVEGGIILSGHTDVVPVEGQAWDSDPFNVIEKDGKLYGRGTCDMKSFIAVCLAMAPEFKKLNLTKPIYFAFSYDEEVGCLGVPSMVEHIGKQLPKPAYAIIGEPTMMQVVTAHKGLMSYETVVHGLEWHSSQPQSGVNAVHYACNLVQFLTELNAELRDSGLQDERFTPPHTTAHVGVIHGGTARNIIPKQCVLNWEIRFLPTDDADALFKRFEAHCESLVSEMRINYPEANIVTTRKSYMAGVTLPDHATDCAQQVKHFAGSNQEFAVSFGTEAGVFNNGGIPSIVCGPGDIEQAHKPNEFVAVSQIAECVTFMRKLCDDVSKNSLSVA